jgi:hypothetical protein
MTVELPPHRVESIFELLDSVAPKQNQLLKHQCDNGCRLRLTGAMRSVLQDFRWYATDLTR